MAGKTGTAEVWTKEGTKKNAWFICYAPFEAPQIAMAILVENASSGGQDAAPIARHILSTYFNIDTPHRTQKPKAVTTNLSSREIVDHLESQSQNATTD